MPIHKPQNLHCFCQNDVSVIVHVGEILDIGPTIQATMVHDLNAVVILIELYRTIALIVAVTDGVHQQLSGSPIRIVNKWVFARGTHWYRPAIGNSCLNKCIQFEQRHTKVVLKLMFGQNLTCTILSCKTHILDICPGDKPAQVFGEKQHTRIGRAIVACVEESETAQLQFHVTLVFFQFIVSHRLWQEYMLELLQVQVVDSCIQARRGIE